jgi:hypothetical protein
LLESGSSLFDDLKADEQGSIDNTITRREKAAYESAALDKIWDLPASIRNDFQEHEPVSMFPDLSSTVPDNSVTQQRLIEEALSNQMMPPPIQQADEPAASTTSTIPWSTYLESPEVGRDSLSHTHLDTNSKHSKKLKHLSKSPKSARCSYQMSQILRQIPSWLQRTPFHT